VLHKRCGGAALAILFGAVLPALFADAPEAPPPPDPPDKKSNSPTVHLTQEG
jgi:hypothetical protein